MKRRTFLKAGLLSLLGGTRAQAATVPHVVVVGAGPAGLSASLELVQRGLFVTLVEAAGQVGGKAKGWTETIDGVAVDVENGVHVLGPDDVHVLDLIERYALQDGLRQGSTRDLGVHTTAGTTTVAGSDFKRFLKARAAERGLVWADLRRAAKVLSKRPASRLRERFGGRAASDVTPTPAGLLVDLLSRARFWVSAEELDAVVRVEAEQRQVLPPTWITGNPQALLWEPLASAFRSQRGKLRLSHRVADLMVEDGRVVGVRVGQPERSWTAAEPATGSWERVPVEEPLFVRRGPDGIEAMHGRCTHAGCSVALEGDGFACPCHGGRYDGNGLNIAGPPPAPLPRARTELDAAGLVVRLGGDVLEIRADAVVLAVDAKAFGRIVQSVLPDQPELPTTNHVVGRFWFDRDVPITLPDAVVVEDAAYVTSTLLVHRLQDAAAAWATAEGGAVVEVHAGKKLPPAMTNDAVLDLLETDVRLLFPSLLEADCRKRTLARGADFTWFRPGWEVGSLPVVTGVPGLYAAGDHVRADLSCHLLERAVATGRLAASAVLESFGSDPVPPVAR